MLRRFPFELPKAFLAMLFAYRNPQKIVAYCRDYALPEVYEKDLIENYRQSLKTPDNNMQYTYFGGGSVNGWAKALEVYLKEQQKKAFLGGLTFTDREKWIVRKHQHTATEDMEDFVLTCIKPWLNSFSPCMCAYLAYYFPELADELWKGLTVRKE